MQGEIQGEIERFNFPSQLIVFSLGLMLIEGSFLALHESS